MSWLRTLTLITMIISGFAAMPAASPAKAIGPGIYRVIPGNLGVYAEPGGSLQKPGGQKLVSTLSKGQFFVVTRLSPSGKYAYGQGVDSEKVFRGWVRSAGLSIRLIVVPQPRFTG